MSKETISSASRKLFVGGLPHNIADNNFRKYWAKFGELVECQIMKDRSPPLPFTSPPPSSLFTTPTPTPPLALTLSGTGRSRGFG